MGDGRRDEKLREHKVEGNRVVSSSSGFVASGASCCSLYLFTGAGRALELQVVADEKVTQHSAGAHSRQDYDRRRATPPC